MTIANVAFTGSGAVTTNDPSFSHTPDAAGDPKGVIVYVVTQGFTDTTNAVTYGGTSMTEVTGSPYAHDEIDDAELSVFFLGSSVPTGTQTVSVNTDDTDSTLKSVGCYTFTAAGDTSVQDTSTATYPNGTTSPVTATALSLGGNTCFVSECLQYGSGNQFNLYPTTGWAQDGRDDLGNQCAGHHSYDTIGSTDVTPSYDHTQNNNGAIFATAIKESAGASFTVPVAYHHLHQMMRA